MMRRSSLRLNVAFNLAGALLPLCVSIFVIPAYLVRVGQSRYGIISLVWLLFGYFGLFDLGLSQATTNHLARTENQTPARQREIFWTASLINTLLGAVGAVILALLGDLILTSFANIPAELRSEIRAAMPWIACLLPLSTTGAVFVGTLEAHERFLELNLIQVIGAVLGQLAPLAAVILLGPRIEIAVAATAVARLITTTPIFILALRQCGRGTLPIFKRATARALFHYGGWITVSNLVGPILVSVDQFMIGAMVGVAAVPRYSIPFNVATRILLVPTAMTRALFPQLTKVGLTIARQRAESITVTVSLALVIICAPLIIVSRSALTIWLGADFSSNSNLVARIIICGVWINGVAYIPYTMLQSQGQPSLAAKLHLYELLPFFAVLWLGIHFFGLVGAALAWSLRVLADAAFLFKAAGFSPRIIPDLTPSFLFLAAAFLLSAFLHNEPLESLVIAGVLFAAALIFAILFDSTFASLYAKVSRRKAS